MAKYLVEASYTAEGLKGLQKDKASGRVRAVTDMVQKMGGKIESFYWAFGDHDVVVIMDMPDNVKAVALATAVSSSGLVRTKTTPLLTAEETDRALAESVSYRPPGR